MPQCKLCNNFAFSNNGVCSLCTYRASDDDFTRAYRKPREYFPRPNGPNDAINPQLVERREVGQGGAFDNSSPGEREVCEILIGKFSEISITLVEAGQRKDHIVTHKVNSQRIDRQGPCRNNTHAKFAIQIGKKTFAGIEMEAAQTFTLDFVREALTRSLADGLWYRIYFGPRQG